MLNFKSIVLGLLSTLIAVSWGSRCFRDSEKSPYLLCYHSGRVSLKETNVSNCTHIIFTNAVADDVIGNGLRIREGVKKDLTSIKENYKDLLTIFTLNLGKNESLAVLESSNKSKHLIEEITSFLGETGFDGIELNFEFTTQGGGSRDSHTSFVKVLSKSLNLVHRRTKRSGYDVTEVPEDDVTTAFFETETTTTSTESGTENDENSKKVEEEKNGENVKRIEIAGDVECDPRFWLILRLPVKLDVIGKKYDLKALSRYSDLLSVSTHNIVNENERDVTYHPSRMMGLSDIYNTDSILDFILGMGAVKSQIVISLPAFVIQFELKESVKNIPGSPVVSEPTYIDQSKLCSLFKRKNWTLERDLDLTAPYAYSGNTWLAFDDEISVNIKGKYILLRELAGGAIHAIDDDVNDEKCTKRFGKAGYLTSVLASNFKNFGRKPRALVLESLQNEIHDRGYSNVEAGVKLSEYRIVRVVDHSGAVHVIRRNTKTQFECSRQGYFSHPLGCNKFYRCVKFDQYSDEFTVFEYDCPTGLAFDERWEVCVWPGSLPDGAPCTGSSEIAPVPRSHYRCPNQEGYYADPENCRWFFVCLDHARNGITPLTAYEFRCPFGLVFNEEKLACDWPWIVGSCGNRGGTGYLGLSTGIHSTFVNGGNLEASYGQYGKSEGFDSFGRGFGSSLKNVNGLSGTGSGQNGLSGSGGIGYIAGQFDDNSNRAPFASYPEFEISGGRVHNKGGVILQENVNFGGISGGSFGKVGSVDIGKETYGKGSLNSFKGAVSVDSNDESSRGRPYGSYPSAYDGASLNSFKAYSDDLESNLYKQSAGSYGQTSFGSDTRLLYGVGGGSDKGFSQGAGTFGGINLGASDASNYKGSRNQQKSTSSKNGGIYSDRVSNVRKLVLPAVDSSQNDALGHSLADSSLPKDSFNTAYQQTSGDFSGEEAHKGNIGQSSKLFIGELHTTSRGSSAITSSVTTARPVTIAQSQHSSLKPDSFSTVLNTPAASFASPTVTPISQTKAAFGGNTDLGGVSFHSLAPNAITTPNTFGSTAGTIGTTGTKFVAPVKTDSSSKLQYKDTLFGYQNSAVSSTPKPVTSTVFSISKGETLKNQVPVSGLSEHIYGNSGFGDLANSFGSTGFVTYGSQLGEDSGSSLAGTAGTSHESSTVQGTSSSFSSSEGNVFGSGYGAPGTGVLKSSLSSHSFEKPFGHSDKKFGSYSHLSSGGSVPSNPAGKVVGSVSTEGLSNGALFSSYDNTGSVNYFSGTSAGGSLDSSAHEGPLGTLGITSSAHEGNSGKSVSGAFNGIHDISSNLNSFTSFGKSTEGSLTTSFGSDKSHSILDSSVSLGGSGSDSLSKDFEKAILTSSGTTSGGASFSSYAGPSAPTTSFNTFGKSTKIIENSSGLSESSLGGLGSHTGSPVSFGISSTSQRTPSDDHLIGSSLGKVANQASESGISNAHFSGSSFESGQSGIYENLGSYHSGISNDFSAARSPNTIKTSNVNSLSSHLGKTADSAFGERLKGSSGVTAFGSNSHYDTLVNSLRQTGSGALDHSILSSPGTSFDSSGNLNSFSTGSSFTSEGSPLTSLGGSYGQPTGGSMTNPLTTSSADSLPGKYEDFVKNSFGKIYGFPVADLSLTSHGSSSTSFGTSGNEDDSGQVKINFAELKPIHKAPTSSQTSLHYRKPVLDFNIDSGSTTGYDKSNINYVTASGSPLKPVTENFEFPDKESHQYGYSGIGTQTSFTSFGHQNLGENDFSTQAGLDILKQTSGITGGNGFEQTGNEKDTLSKNLFETPTFYKQTYGEAIKFNNPATNYGNSPTVFEHSIPVSNVDQSKTSSFDSGHSKTETEGKIFESYQTPSVPSSFGSSYSGQSEFSGFNSFQSTGQPFKIIVPNKPSTYSSEKFQHATDVTIEKQPIVKVSGIEPVDYGHDASTQKTLTTKYRSDDYFAYTGAKTAATKPNFVSKVTSAPAITTFAPFTFKHGSTKAQATSTTERPNYPEPIIHNRTRLIGTKLLTPVVQSTTLPTPSTFGPSSTYSDASYNFESSKSNTVSLKTFTPAQTSQSNGDYSQQGETDSKRLYQDQSTSFGKSSVKPVAQVVVDVTPKPVTYHGLFESTGNKHVFIQSEQSSGSGQETLKNGGREQEAKHLKSGFSDFEQGGRGQSLNGGSPGGIYYNEELLESAKPTIMTSTKFLSTTQSYKPKFSLVQEEPLPASPPTASLPVPVYTSQQQESHFGQFDLDQIKTKFDVRDGLSTHLSGSGQPEFSINSKQSDLRPAKLDLLVPGKQYGLPSTKTTTAGPEVEYTANPSSSSSLPGSRTFDHASRTLESYGKFFEKQNQKSDESYSSLINSNVRKIINPNIEINPPPREYLLGEQVNIENFGKGTKVKIQEYSGNSEDSQGGRYSGDVGRKNSYDTTIGGGNQNVPDLYKGRYGKVITDEGFGEKLSGLHYDVMKIKTREKSKGRQFDGLLFSSEIPATNKYEEYEIENERDYERGRGRGESGSTTSDFKNKGKKTVLVSQTSDANPILVGKLAGQCSCQSNLLELKDRKNQKSTGGSKQKSRQHENAQQEGENSNILKYSGKTASEGSTRSGLDGHVVDYVATASPSFQPDDVVSIAPSPSLPTRQKQFRGKARFLTPSPHLYYSGPDSSLPSPISASQIASDGENRIYGGEESKRRGKIRGQWGGEGGAGAAFDRYGPGGWRSYDETLQGSVDCKRPGLFRHPKYCNKFYACNYDPWEERFTLHIFNCPIRLTYDSSISACNWPVGGPACADDNLLV